MVYSSTTLHLLSVILLLQLWLPTVWENSDFRVNSSSFISSKTLPVSYQSTGISTLNDPCIVANIISGVIISQVYQLSIKIPADYWTRMTGNWTLQCHCLIVR